MRSRTTTHVAIILALALGGCASEGGEEASVGGRVADLDEARAVRASRLEGDGSATLLAEATVRSDGTYAIGLPPDSGVLILEAVDASGEARASAIFEGTGAAGTSAIATPMDAESSVEAAVLRAMVGLGGRVEHDAVDVRARIDAATAAAARASGRTELAITALAEAVLAAQRTAIEAYGRAGVDVGPRATSRARLAASQRLSSDLHARAPVDAAHDAFFRALAEADASLGIDAVLASRAEMAAATSFRAALRARLGSEASLRAAFDAAVIAASDLEARAHATALVAILEAGGASTATIEAAARIGERLRASLRTAAGEAAVAEAYARFAGELRGGGALTGSLVADWLEVGLVEQLTLDAVLAASADARAVLGGALDGAARGAVSPNGGLEADALARGVVDAYGGFATALDAQASVLAGIAGAGRARAAVDLLAIADGSYAASASP